MPARVHVGDPGRVVLVAHRGGQPRVRHQHDVPAHRMHRRVCGEPAGRQPGRVHHGGSRLERLVQPLHPAAQHPPAARLDPLGQPRQVRRHLHRGRGEPQQRRVRLGGRLGRQVPGCLRPPRRPRVGVAQQHPGRPVHHPRHPAGRLAAQFRVGLPGPAQHPGVLLGVARVPDRGGHRRHDVGRIVRGPHRHPRAPLLKRHGGRQPDHPAADHHHIRRLLRHRPLPPVAHGRRAVAVVRCLSSASCPLPVFHGRRAAAVVVLRQLCRGFGSCPDGRCAVQDGNGSGR